jgi:ATP-dependent exoDNAse (exonuclease V) alpha subunit
VIARKNDRDLDLCNSESFTVTKINVKEELLEMTEEGGDRVLHIPFDDFQKLFYVAWCITLHKSQGCTFDHEYTIHEMDHPRFDARAKYVALSRSTTLEYIKVW